MGDRGPGWHHRGGMVGRENQSTWTAAGQDDPGLPRPGPSRPRLLPSGATAAPVWRPALHRTTVPARNRRISRISQMGLVSATDNEQLLSAGSDLHHRGGTAVALVFQPARGSQTLTAILKPFAFLRNLYRRPASSLRSLRSLAAGQAPALSAAKEHVRHEDGAASVDFLSLIEMQLLLESVHAGRIYQCLGQTP